MALRSALLFPVSAPATQAQEARKERGAMGVQETRPWPPYRCMTEYGAVRTFAFHQGNGA